MLFCPDCMKKMEECNCETQRPILKCEVCGDAFKSYFDENGKYILLSVCPKCVLTKWEKKIDTKQVNSHADKFDKQKTRYELMSPLSLCGLAEILTAGAKKYGDRNWEKGLEWSRIIGAIFRHLFAWMDGEDCDIESGYNHMDHVACNVHFLQHYIKTKTGKDDRKHAEHFDKI